jgi:hypothetical protein
MAPFLWPRFAQSDDWTDGNENRSTTLILYHSVGSREIKSSPNTVLKRVADTVSKVQMDT